MTDIQVKRMQKKFLKFLTGHGYKVKIEPGFQPVLILNKGRKCISAVEFDTKLQAERILQAWKEVIEEIV